LIKYYLKLIATVVALGVIYYTIDRALFWEAIRSADLKFLSIGIFLFFPGQILSAYRWYFILAQLGHVMPFRRILYHSVLGQLWNLVLPGQVSGELVKLFSVSRRQIKKTPIILSIVIDKIALLLGVAIFALIGVFGFGPVSVLIGVHLVALIAIILTTPVMFVLCQYRSDLRESRLIRVLVRSPFIGNYVLKTFGDLPVLPYISSSGILKIIVSALFLLSFYAAGAYFVALSLHIEINPVDWVAINAIVAFVQIFPVTVGGLGVREGTFGVLLSLYGISFSQAVVFSLTGFVLGAVLTSLFWFALDSIEGVMFVK